MCLGNIYLKGIIMDDYYTDSMENTTDFLSDLEQDPFNPYEYEMSTYEKIYQFLVEYLVSTAHMLLCVAILFASTLFFYSFYKFKRLQTRTNYILLNFYICITLSSIFFTIIQIMEAFRSYYYNHIIFFLLFTLVFSFIDAALIFALILAQDWILSASNTRSAQKYQNFYKWMIGGVYLIVLSHFILYKVCERRPIEILAITCALIYLINGLVLIVFNVIRYKKKFSEESKQILYALNVASVFYLMWLPPVTLLLLSVFISSFDQSLNFSVVVILACVIYFFEFISFSAPVVIVYLLPKWDKNFKMAFDYVFKSSIRQYQPNDNNSGEV